jgi:hypothetical protein
MAAADRYPERLPGDPSSSGQFASLFYDDGRFGAYGELELYGHRTPEGAGLLEVDAFFAVGPETALLDWIDAT